MSELPESVCCERCHAVIGEVIGGRLKIRVRSRLVAVRDDGRAEMPCPFCRADTDLPLVFARRGLTADLARE